MLFRSLAVAEAFVAALGVPVEEGDYDAHYRIDLDRIFMPRFATFRDPAAHVGTLIHECAHADRRTVDRGKSDRETRLVPKIEDSRVGDLRLREVSSA